MKRLLALLSMLAVAAVHFASGAAQTPFVLAQNVQHIANVPGGPGGHIVFDGDRMYMGSYGLGFRIFDISNPASPVEIGNYLPGGRADAVPDAFTIGSRRIAVLGGTNRSPQTQKTEFLDVTDAAAPKVLWTFDGEEDGESHNADFFPARKLYFPSGGKGRGGLRIYDLEPLLGTPAKAPAELFAGNPVTLWNSSPHRRGRPVGHKFTHTHDIQIYPDHRVLLPRSQWVDRNGDRRGDPTYVKRDIILLAEGGNYSNTAGNTGSVFIIDVTDPTRPVVMNRWIHESGPGHSPIRYNHEAQLLDGDRSVMLVTDEDFDSGCGKSGGIWAVRLSHDLTNAVEQSEWRVPAETNRPVCSSHVFSTHGRTVYLGAYNAGLQVVDYSNPRRPRRVGYYTADGATSWGAYWHKGYVYVGDVARGLDVFKLTVRTR